MKRDVLEVQRQNIRTLQRADVRLAIGSDGISGESPIATARDEVPYPSSNRLIDGKALLRAWAEITPQTILPDRKLGRLSEAYEANFLVHAGDPLSDVENLFRITTRVKRGAVLGGSRSQASGATR